MTWFFVLTLLFTLVSAALILIILVQRPQGGGLAGAFGGAGGGGTDTVFGGRVGDALTWATVVGFIVWLSIAVGLNLAPTGPPPAQTPGSGVSAPVGEGGESVPGTADPTAGIPLPTGAPPAGPMLPVVPPPAGDDGETP